MSELLQSIAAYVPPAVIRTTLQEPSPAPPQAATADRFPAAILFADVSGFTPLTEALAQKGSEGPEELTRLLNGYFSRMIALIEAQGGEVVKFSGDAVTAVFPALAGQLGSTTRRAMQAAEAMQAAMAEFATLETSVGPIALGMKIGIGAGETLAAQVGGGQGRWEYVIAGDPLRQVAQAEHQAQRGEIVLSPEAQAIISPQPVAAIPHARPDWQTISNPEAVESALRCFVPRAVLSWLGGALQEWLAVLRPMSVLFIGVEGLDYEQPDAVDRLHEFLRAAQAIIRRYEGSINKLAIDDKGTILLGLFGAPPQAHEDDPERAVRCAMDLQTMASGQQLQLAIGVSTGRVFAGPVGSAHRREYTVMGDTVNLAARLMSLAGSGQLRCGYETYRWSRNRLAYDALAPVSLKGKAGLIRVYRPTGEAGEKEVPGAPLVGREAEMAQLAAALEALSDDDQQTFCLFIEGEAGIGKTRLVEELVLLMHQQGIAGLKGMGRSIEQQTPYRAWRDIFASYFMIEEIEDPVERRRQVEEQVLSAVPQLAERLPLLNDVLNLGLPENELTSSLDTHLRHESLTSLLLSLLDAWTAEEPLVLVLEDAHWLDSLSWDLTLQLARSLSIGRRSLLLVVVARPVGDEAMKREPAALRQVDITEHMVLGILSPEETLTLAANRLGLDGPLPPEVASLVRSRAGGNPFFAEELVYALRDTAQISLEEIGGRVTCVVNEELDKIAQTLPDTVEGIVLSRIDRLQPHEQLTLKVAAVIGRTFAYSTLQDTLGEHMEISRRLLLGYLDDLSQLDLTPLEVPEPELTYIFKHIITQEVAYETLLFAQRRQLHQSVARWYEEKYGQDRELPASGDLESALSPYYPLLVYHWHQAEDRGRERRYARLAGQWAAAQFANVEAVGYLSRALELTGQNEQDARYELLLAREAVNDLQGQREAQALDLEALTLLAGQLGVEQRQAEAALRLANYLEEISDYPAALVAAQHAVESAAKAGDAPAEAAAYIAWGKTLWRQGEFEAACRPLTKSIDTGHGGAQSLYYLGHVFLYQGNYALARDYYQQALDLYRAAGQRQGEADSLSMLGIIMWELGDYSAGQEYGRQVLSIYRTLGDRRGETLILNNLATVECDLGDYGQARDHHQRALELRLTIADRFGEANSLVNLGLVYHNLDDQEAAHSYCQRALAIQREIGDRRGQGYSLTYLGHIQAALGYREAATAAYREAMGLRRELGQQSLAIDDLAGLARSALADQKLDQAALMVDEILEWIESNGTNGIEYPRQVSLTCYQVLQARAQGDPAVLQQAHEILAQAHSALQTQAEGISDLELRRKFLENVKTNREIIAIWQAQATG